MTHRPTVRLSRTAHRTLDEIARRTERHKVWLLTQAVHSLAAELVADAGLVARYGYAPTGDDRARVSLRLSPDTDALVHAICLQTESNPGVVLRAAWMRWLDVRAVDDIVSRCGSVRPKETA